MCHIYWSSSGSGKMSLRSATEIPFLGTPAVEKISGTKLPTELLIFCLFFTTTKHWAKTRPTPFILQRSLLLVVGSIEQAGCKTKKIDGIKNDMKKWTTMHQVLTTHQFLKFVHVSMKEPFFFSPPTLSFHPCLLVRTTVMAFLRRSSNKNWLVEWASLYLGEQFSLPAISQVWSQSANLKW